jgi:hypothetical protein
LFHPVYGFVELDYVNIDGKRMKLQLISTAVQNKFDGEAFFKQAATIVVVTLIVPVVLQYAKRRLRATACAPMNCAKLFSDGKLRTGQQ